MDNLTNIAKLLDLQKFQHLQDSLAYATELALITVDYKGVPLTKHSNCSDFCKLVRQNPLTSKHCQRCDSRGGLESVIQNKPYAYLCHYKLVDIAVPIVVDNKYIGAVMAGQIKLKNHPDDYELEQIVTSSGNYSLIMNISSYSQAFKKIPKIDYDLFIKNVQLIETIMSYIISESILKLNIEQTNYHFTNTRKMSEDKEKNIQILSASKQILTPNSRNYDTAKNIIQPVLTFMQENPNTFINSIEAAKLCNVTPSYFSKIFKKVMTIGYIEYLNEQKMSLAKNRLITSNSSIESISEALGFSSTSYFIKMFKKHENLTPTLFRKYYAKGAQSV